jgi:hypothetical protein
VCSSDLLKVLPVIPQVLTYGEMGKINEVRDEILKFTQINIALKQDNFVKAEYIKGKPLTNQQIQDRNVVPMSKMNRAVQESQPFSVKPPSITVPVVQAPPKVRIPIPASQLDYKPPSNIKKNIAFTEPKHSVKELKDRFKLLLNYQLPDYMTRYTDSLPLQRSQIETETHEEKYPVPPYNPAPSRVSPFGPAMENVIRQRGQPRPPPYRFNQRMEDVIRQRGQQRGQHEHGSGLSNAVKRKILLGESRAGNNNPKIKKSYLKIK